MAKYIATTLVLGALIIVAGLYLVFAPAPAVAPTEDEQQVLDFTYVNATDDMIQVDLPFLGAVVGKEFSVLGVARGTWYFEASFPVVLLDKDGNVLAQGHAEAQEDWMSEEFVPFKADLVVTNQNYIGPATLILKNDNPSGDPVRDRSVSLPITVEY